MSAPLAGRTAIVTGVGQSVGRAVALRLAADGAHVLCADRDGVVADEVRDEAIAGGGSAEAAAVDVRTRAGLDRAVERVLASHGRLSVMCNADAIPADGYPLADVPEKAFDEVFGTNFLGVLYGCQAAGRAMSAAGGGSIVNVISATLDQSVPGSGSYAIANASVALLTKVMAREVGSAQVRVNAIAITPVEGSPGSYDAPGATDPDDPVGHGVLGRAAVPGDVVGLAAYLASDASAYLTGQTIRLSGGRTMQW
jgi:3-oxoacyl-[acyl-carrier protein] reductase